MNSGLEGVVVAETRLSEVDGQAGELVISGYRLERFAALDFETAAAELLGAGVDLGDGRGRAFDLLENLLPRLHQRSSIEAMRLGLSALPSESDAATVAGAFPVILGATVHGSRLARPDARLGQVHDLLRMFLAREPQPVEVDGLSRYLVTVSEHGMNASTFTARVIASTGAPMLDAVVGALAALKGPLHGGAPGPVLDLLDEMAASPDMTATLASKIAGGQRLMGFGHRIYRTRDPRAEVLKEAVARLSAGATGSSRLKLAEQVERLAMEALAMAKPGRKLETNVEFYTAVLLERMGFARQHFTPLFATGRVLGWIAHWQEQRAVGRLIRPDSVYIGERPEALR